MDFYKDVILNFKEYSKRFLKIKDKNSKIIPFELNTSQKIIEQVRSWCRSNGYLERYLILKARQKGISTYWEAILDWQTSTLSNIKAVVIGHVETASRNLFEMVQRFYKYKPDPMKPATQNTNERKIRYSKLDSEVTIKTAGVSGEGTGRSDTINKLHCTEVAFWNNPEQTLLALLQAVPDIEDSLVVLETTANGLGNEYHRRWQTVYGDANKVEIVPNVAWKSPTDDYIAIFISWLIDDEYTRAFEDDTEKEKLIVSLNDNEKLLLKNGATYEHLKWRRFTVKGKCNGSEELFKQEYPSTPEEAFLVSGRPVFDVVKCTVRLESAKKIPYKRGDLIPIYDESDEYKAQVMSKRNSYYDLLPYLKSVEFIENQRGFIKLWGEIVLNEGDYYRFAGGWDVAEGLEQGDFSDGSYLDRKTMKVVLAWHGHIDPDLLAEEQHKISVFLGKQDVICTERNNHGLTTIVGAYKLGLNQYYQETFTEGFVADTSQLGFSTSSQSKPIIINDLNEFIREDLFIDYDDIFWGQTLTFVRNERGQMNAQGKDKDPNSKCFDDAVINRALMIRCHKWLYNYYENAKKEERRSARTSYVESSYERSDL